ncbi:MAG: cysteine dioxygenase family protein [Thermodesulfobacteriota bacterium]
MISLKPQTYLGHPNQERIRLFLRELFVAPNPNTIETEAPAFFAETPVPLPDFPPFAPLYSRTILYRAENRYEAMAARWSKGAVSPIHGHPMFAFYYLLEGELSVENYKKSASGISKTDTRIYKPGQHFCMLGKAGAFDNGIHRVSAVQESLSIHIYSDDAMKGEIFHD